MLRAAPIFFTASVAFAALATAQIRVESPADPYLHDQTGFVFPARVVSGVRHHVTRYDTDGSDLGVDYQVARNGRMIAFVSVFVYPAPVLKIDTPATRAAACSSELAGMKRDLLAHEPEAKMVKEEVIVSPTGRSAMNGLRAAFTGGRTKFDGVEREVNERADLFCYAGEKWLIAYRVTSLTELDATPEVEALVRALRWPETLTS